MSALPARLSRPVLVVALCACVLGGSVLPAGARPANEAAEPVRGSSVFTVAAKLLHQLRSALEAVDPSEEFEAAGDPAGRHTPSATTAHSEGDAGPGQSPDG